MDVRKSRSHQLARSMGGMASSSLVSAVRSITGQAVKCRTCFGLGEVEAAQITVAQPRWVGQDYAKSNPRIAIVMLNPGSGAFRSDSANAKMLDLLHELSENGGSLRAIFAHQASDMPNWGEGRFTTFYLDGLNLHLRKVTFENIAWCAAKGIKYPKTMLQRCFTPAHVTTPQSH